jgi:DNA-binding NarL/FixJ family response regulator
MGTTSIVLADDHHIVRQGVKALLESEPDFCVVGEASDGMTALAVTGRENRISSWPT